MSTLTPQEKRKILQERRAAKMTGAKASTRLNDILTQGNSVKTETTSILEKSDKATETASVSATTTTDSNPITNAGPTPTPAPLSALKHFDDPDTSDIEQLLSHRVSPNGAPTSNDDLDDMLNKMFGGSGQTEGAEDPIAAMMMNMMKQQQQTDGESTTDPTYEAQLLKHNMYEQKRLKFRFLIVRFLCIIINFGYHYSKVENFNAASYAYIREAVIPQTNFAAIFASIEAVILSSFYIISTRRRVSENVSGDNLLLKLVSMASMVVPAIQNYQPLLIQAVKYYELFNMLISDLALVVVLFGLTSVIS